MLLISSPIKVHTKNARFQTKKKPFNRSKLNKIFNKTNSLFYSDIPISLTTRLDYSLRIHIYTIDADDVHLKNS